MSEEKKWLRKVITHKGVKIDVKAKDENELLRRVAEKISKIDRGEVILDDSMLVSAWFERWMVLTKDSKDMTAKSRNMYREKFDRYIRPRIGNMRLREVKDYHLQEILNGQKGMSYSHVSKLRMTMQQMFRRARQSHLIEWDPAELLEMPATKKGTHRALTAEERSAILALAETHPSGLWILTLLYTGMRPGEAAALKWADVDLDGGMIYVHAARESGVKNTVKAPKTEAGNRIIPIHDELLPRLRQAKRGRRSREWVFTSQAGGQLSENSIRRLWTSFRRDLDISCGAELYRNKIVRSKLSPDLVPYCLRHTFATDLEAAGVPLNVARELLGHADIQTTANIYTHRSEETLRAAMAALSARKTAENEKPQP